jgi:hypothetical protein
MSLASDNEEETTATIGCVHDRSDDYYSEEETDWEADNLESARKWSSARRYIIKCEQEHQQWEKAKAQRAANAKHEEAKKSEFCLKMLSKLLNEKDEAEAYISSMVLGFLLTWKEATRDESHRSQTGTNICADGVRQGILVGTIN